MVKRNLSLPYTFVCFTDNNKDINSNITTEFFPNLSLEGWWNKLWFLSEQFPLDGTILFLDLDLIIFDNINKLFEFETQKFCIIRDFNRKFVPNWSKVNSSVFRFQSKQYSKCFEKFYKNRDLNTRKYRGDQDYIFNSVQDLCFWPDDWIQSYKWEMRSRQDLVKINGKQNFVKIAKPKIKSNTSIAVFHGSPNPQECTDPWVIKNWR